MNIPDLTPEEYKRVSSLMEKAMTSPRDLTDEERALLEKFQPENAEGRECGDCIFCCQAPAIEADHILDDEPVDFEPKPACVECWYAVDGVGCSVYNSRPSVCRSYKCLYLLGLTKVRPDEGLVAWSFQIIPDGPLKSLPMAVGHSTDVAKVLTNPDVVEDIQGLFEMGIPSVVLRDNRIATQMIPGKGNSVVAKVDQKDPMKVRILEDTQQVAPWDIETYSEDNYYGDIASYLRRRVN